MKILVSWIGVTDLCSLWDSPSPKIRSELEKLIKPVSLEFFRRAAPKPPGLRRQPGDGAEKAKCRQYKPSTNTGYASICLEENTECKSISF